MKYMILFAGQSESIVWDAHLLCMKHPSLSDILHMSDRNCHMPAIFFMFAHIFCINQL